MKNFTQTLLALGFTFAMTASSLLAQQIFTLDENGNITMNGGPDPVPVPFQVAPDPSGGVAANVLIYQLPFLVTPGDVLLQETPGTTSPSVVVRFFSPAGATASQIIFYSDATAADPADSLADSGLPVSPNAIPIPEVGPEGNNGALWTPVPGQPGSLPTGGQVVYQIISDVPEPGSTALMCAGLGVLLGVRRFRQKVTAT